MNLNFFELKLEMNQIRNDAITRLTEPITKITTNEIWMTNTRFKINQLEQTNEITAEGYIEQRLFARVGVLGEVDVVLAEARLEEHEHVVDLADSEKLYEQHGAKEYQHFPHADEDVGEVTRRLHLLLDFAQIFHETFTFHNEDVHFIIRPISQSNQLVQCVN